jgi:integrase
MASIRQRSGRWQARVIRKGFQPETKTFNSRDEALKWSRAMEAEMDRGVFVSIREAERTTLADLLDRYAKEVSPSKRSHDSEKALLKKLATFSIGRLSLANLTPKAVGNFRDERLASVQASTTIRQLAVLRAVINHARREWGFAIDNPVEKIRMPSTPRHRERVLSPDEEVRLLEVLTAGELRTANGTFSKATRDVWVKPMAIVAVESAMRRGELLSLKWKNVDLSRRVAYLPITKNGNPRTVPLSMRAVEVLGGLPRSIDGRVFPIEHWTVEQVFERACRVAGVADFRFHDLRHTATSRLSRKVPNLIELAAITGHSNVGMLKRYYHITADELAEKIA